MWMHARGVLARMCAHARQEWLAEHVQLGAAEILDVGFEVPIGGRVVHLRRRCLPAHVAGDVGYSLPARHHRSAFYGCADIAPLACRSGAAVLRPNSPEVG